MANPITPSPTVNTGSMTPSGSSSGGGIGSFFSHLFSSLSPSSGFNFGGSITPPSNAPSVPTTPPTVNAPIVGNTSPISIPTAPQYTNVSGNALGVSIGNANNGNPSTPPPAPVVPPPTSTTTEPTLHDQILGALGGLNSQIATQGETSNKAYEDAGIWDKMHGLNDINNRILTTDRSYQQQAKKIKDNATGTFGGAVEENLQVLDRQRNEDLANLSIIKTATTNDLATAQSIVDKKLQFQFAPIQAQIDNLGKFLEYNNANLTDSEKIQLENQRFVMQQNLNQLIQAKQNAHEYALNAGITDPTVLSSIDRATTPTEAYGAVGQVFGNSNINGGTGTTGNSDGTIGGYDFSTYATDPNKVNSTTQIYNGITTALGGNQLTTAAQAQGIISALSPNSPITGDMIFKAANQYGIDPAVLIANMQQESNLGTKGRAIGTFNPGNVGNVDSGAGRNYGTWENGVAANAAWLANHKAGGSTTTTQAPGSTPTAPKATPAPNAYTSVVQSAPPLIRSAVKQLPNGQAYIDMGQLPDAKLGLLAQSFAAKNGIRALSKEDADTVQAVMQSVNNLQINANMFSNLSNKTGAGALLSNLTNPFSTLFNTNYGGQLDAYNKNKDSLFQQISTLAGSHPRLNSQELLTAANALPTLRFGNHDTIKQGIDKLTITQAYLNNALKSIIPGYVGSPINVGGGYATMASDGKTYLFPDQNAAIGFMTADNK